MYFNVPDNRLNTIFHYLLPIPGMNLELYSYLLHSSYSSKQKKSNFSAIATW